MATSARPVGLYCIQSVGTFSTRYVRVDPKLGQIGAKSGTFLRSVSGEPERTETDLKMS